MLYLNTLLKELRNRYVGVPKTFCSTNADCENDHVRRLRTEASIPENFQKTHYEKAYLLRILTKDTWKVFKCGVGEGWRRSVGLIM
jgi:hypothetical protein